MKQEVLIQKVKDVLMFLVMVIGNIFVFSGLGNVLFGGRIGSFNFIVGVMSLLIGGVLNYLYWFRYKSVKKIEKKITEPITTSNDPIMKTNQSSILEPIWRRLTWGFLPEGWRRILLLLPHVFWIVFGLAEDELDDGWKTVEFIIIAVSITWMIGAGLSLVVSWVYDGFKKK